MGTAAFLFGGMQLAPQPWKSDWRRDFERYREQTAVAGEGFRTRSKSVRKIQSRTEGYLPARAGRPRGGMGGPARVRVDRRPRKNRFCTECGTRFRVDGKVCLKCKSKLDDAARPECSMPGCTRKLRSTNRTGLCKPCWRRERYRLRTGTVRRFCKWTDETHCCCEPITQRNQRGLCGFHRPDLCGRKRYVIDSPRLALREGGAA